MPKVLVIFGNLNILYGLVVILGGILTSHMFLAAEEIAGGSSYGLTEYAYIAVHSIAGGLLIVSGLVLGAKKPFGFYLTVIACLAQMANKVVGTALIVTRLTGESDENSIALILLISLMGSVFSPGGVYLLIQLIVLSFHRPSSWTLATEQTNPAPRPESE